MYEKLLVFFCFTVATVTSSQDDVCPKSSKWIQHGDLCARVEDEAVSWRMADTNCRQNEGRSVHVNSNSSEMFEWLKQNHPNNSEYWVGARIPALTLPSYFDRCKTGHEWRGVCYEVVMSPMTWYTASKYCGNNGGYLVQINDEETNVAVASVAEAVLGKYDRHSPHRPTSFWIDGRSDGGASVTFLDRRGIRLNYTNLRPEIAIDVATLCLEVYTRRSSHSQVPQPTEAPTSLYNSYYDVSENGQHESPTHNVTYDVYEYYATEAPGTEIPIYNIVNCHDVRYFLCQYNLSERAIVEEPAADQPLVEGDTPNDYSHVYSPTQVKSCADIVVLRELSLEIKKNFLKSPDSRWITLETSLLDPFIRARNAYYIVAVKPTEGSREKVSFELRYCDLNMTKSQMLWESSERGYHIYVYLSMLQWGSFEAINDTSSEQDNDEERDEVIEPYHNFPIGGNFTFEGSCVDMNIDLQGMWSTSICSRNLSYICEYHPSRAQEIAGKQKSPAQELRNRLQETEDMLGRNESSQTRPMASTIHDMLHSIVVASEQHGNDPSLISESSLDELDGLLSSALSLVDHFRKEDTMVQNGIENAEEDDFVDIQAISLLAAQVADKFSEEQSNSNNQQLHYNTSSSEIRIILLGPETEESLTTSALSFQPEVIERNTQIKVYPDESLLRGDSPVALVYGVHQRSTTHSGTIMMDPDIIMDDNDTKHIKLDNMVPHNASWKLATPIITATLRINRRSISIPVQFQLPKIDFRSLQPVDQSQVCAFLSHRENDTVWSDGGCSETASESSGVYQCTCNHTTDFAVLLLVFPTGNDTIPDDHLLPLYILTFIGELVSILSLVATMCIYMMLRSSLKSDRITVHLNLMFSLLLSHIVVVMSQWTNHRDKEEPDVPCIVKSVLIHIFFLSTMSWMLIEGHILYKKILVVFTRETNVFQWKYCAIAWSAPCVIVAITGVTCFIRGIPYTSDRCWLSIENGVIWSFAGPVMVVVLINLIILPQVIRVAIATKRRRIGRRRSLQTNQVSSKTSWKIELKIAARGVVILTPLLGVTWIFGFLVGIHVIFAYAFVFCNAFQGLYIMLFYVFMNPEVRTAWQERKRIQARDMMHASQFPKSTHHRKWVPRLSLSLLTRLSTSASSSTHPSPTEQGSKLAHLHGVNDFVGIALPSRPHSGRSVLEHARRVAASSVTSVRMRTTNARSENDVSWEMTTNIAFSRKIRVSAEDEANSERSVNQREDTETIDELYECIEFDDDDDPSLESKNSDESINSDNEIEDVGEKLCSDVDDDLDLGRVEIAPDANDAPSDVIDAIGDVIEHISKTHRRSADTNKNERAPKKKERGQRYKNVGGKSQKNSACRSLLCPICNKDSPLKKTTETGKKLAIAKKNCGRPSSCGEIGRDKRGKNRKQRRNKREKRAIPEAWPPDSRPTARRPSKFDDPIGQLENHTPKSTDSERPQTSGSHDSGIIMTP